MISWRLIFANSKCIMKEKINKFYSTVVTAKYQDAVTALNDLQSNANYLKNAPKHDATNNTTLQNTKKYLLRSGINLDDLNKLAVIHIAGTKGKGSTCAFVEAIMREKGYQTGLYTSPHLVSVRERMKINGQSISEAEFTRNFFQLYEILQAKRQHDSDMPAYFQFLTIMMFHVFLKSSIDIAIIEVGIGGELDCTNVIQKPICVGITKLDFDHMTLLGNTLSLIARQKSGIFKDNIPAFTVPQENEALEVLQQRSVEKNCTLNVVPAIVNYPFAKNPPILGITADVQYYNASLAIQLATAWLMNSPANKDNKKNQTIDEFIGSNIRQYEKALAACRWPGRTQILRGKCINFYLDGAHTIESMKSCVAWYNSHTINSSKRILIFNVMGNRDSTCLLNILKTLNFNDAYFVPSLSGGDSIVDQNNKTTTTMEQMKRCEKNREIWGNHGFTVTSVRHALDVINAKYHLNDGNLSDKVNLLITGSLHLIGAALSLLDPELTMKTKF